MNSPTYDDPNEGIHVVPTLGKHAVDTILPLGCIKNKPKGGAYRVLIKHKPLGDEVPGNSAEDHFALLRCQVAYVIHKS